MPLNGELLITTMRNLTKDMDQSPYAEFLAAESGYRKR